MSVKPEQWGIHDRKFSGWHRTLGPGYAMYDIDGAMWMEGQGGRCVALLETASYTDDRPNDSKTNPLLLDLARRARCPAMVVLYKCRMGCDLKGCYMPGDIVEFKSRMLWPIHELVWLVQTPLEFQSRLAAVRDSGIA